MQDAPPKRVPRAAFPAGLVLATGLIAVSAATDLLARPFLPTPSFEAGGADRIVAGDFDGDGRTDFAVTNVDAATGNQSVGLLLGEGGGLYRYAGAAFISTLDFVTAFYGGDFNQDGKPDLLLGGPNPLGIHIVHVLLGQGNGSFMPVAPLTVGGTAFLADGNADGRPDLIVASGSGATSRLQVWPGALNGTFTPLAAFTAPAGVDFGKQPLAVGDLNGDQIADVVATHSAGNASVVLRGAANGTYAIVQTLATGMPTRVAHLADLGGDGAADLVLETQSPGLYILLNAWRGHGDGTFDASPYWTETVGSTGNSGQWVTDLTSGDLNGDGARDLAAVSLQGVQLFFGGGGAFTASGTLAVGLNPTHALFGDFDGAGPRDIAVVHASAVSLVLAAPDGTYRPRALPQSVSISEVPRIVTADFTGDGLADVAALHAQVPPCDDPACPWGEVEAWPALAQGGFGAPGFHPIGVAPVDLRAVDLDRDGKLDLVAVNQGETTVSGSLSLLRGRGDGTFEAEVRIPLAVRPWAVTAGDLDQDGDTDLAVANLNDSTITVLLRTAAGGYAPQPLLSAGRLPIRIAAVDLDGDGVLDLAVADQGKYETQIPADVCWFRGRGNGTFDPRVVLFDEMQLTSDLTVADVDADGDPDLVVTDEGSASHELGGNPKGGLHVIRNQGLGVFAPTSYPAPTFPLHVRVADFNGDGSVDLLTENGTEDLGLYPGLGNGTFGPVERFSVWGCRNFEPVRLAGDGDMDLLTACSNVAWIENEATPASPGLRFVDAQKLRWDPLDLVTGYDVIRGSLSVLRASGGDFRSAVLACVQNDGPLHTVDVAAPIPPVGSGFFYLVRPIGWNGTPGTYDGENPGQAAPRDASIHSSPSACP